MKHRRAAKFVIISALTGLACAAAVFVGNIIVEKALRSSYFAVKTISVQGVLHADGKKIEGIVRKMAGKNIFDIRQELLRDVDDPWVERLEVRKIFPETIKVIVYEQRPIADVVRGNKCFSATAAGNFIPKKCDGELVTIKKGVSQENVIEFLKIYDELDAVRGKKIVLHPLHFSIFENNTEILSAYSKGNFEEQYKIYSSRLKKRYSEVKYSDLRIPGKIYVEGVLNASG